MSSPEPSESVSSLPENQLGSRRRQRSCDACKKKRRRCSGVLPSTDKCVGCANSKRPCTWIFAAIPTQRISRKYVRNLEARVAETERLLHELQTRPAPPAGSAHTVFDGKTATTGEQRSMPAHANDLEGCGAGLLVPAAGSSLSDEDEDSECSGRENDGLLLPLSQKAGKTDGYRFFVGRSSEMNLIRTALNRKAETGSDWAGYRTTHPPPDVAKLWPWEQVLFQSPNDPNLDERYVFPEADLLTALVDLYFTRMNAFYPLLHRPTLEESIAIGLHHRDKGFAVVLLLVCAVASRFSDDPRVLLDPASTSSAGWMWFNQVHRELFSKPILARPCLSDLQMYCLSVLFLQGSSASSVCWAMIGIGIRHAQEVGAHRRKVYNRTPSVDDELWKRAFWVLVHLDRTIAYGLGRSCAIQDEDFDLDLPVCCDDEYWVAQDGRPAFEQPVGKPAYVAYFICIIDLYRILAVALRTVYSINKSRTMLGFVGPKWQQHVVSELDSALNKWIDSIPAHLQWDPRRTNELHFSQSAVLHLTYHHLQIIVHRPFIASPRRRAPASQKLAQPSLAICANAAHAYSRILDVLRRLDVLSLPHTSLAAFTAALVLLLSVWRKEGTAGSANVQEVLADVYTCIDALRSIEQKWNFVRVLRELLSDLLVASKLVTQAELWQVVGAEPTFPPPADENPRHSRPASEAQPGPGSNAPSFCQTAGTNLARDTFDTEPSPGASEGLHSSAGLPLKLDALSAAPLEGSASPSQLSPILSRLKMPLLQSSAGLDESALSSDTPIVWSDLLSNFELEGWTSYFDLVGGMDTDPPSV